MLSLDPPGAYLAIVDAMRGLSVSELYRATFKVLNASVHEWSIEGSIVVVPRPHPAMRALVALLGNHGYATHVITASHQIIARIACIEWFGIPEEWVYGVRSEMDGDRLTDRILSPVPIGPGKRDVYRTFVGTDPPTIVGGDSSLDVPMLDLVRPDGLVFWVGEDRNSFALMKARIGGLRSFVFVHRPSHPSGQPALAVA
jgi:phosphoserine phosphatase